MKPKSSTLFHFTKTIENLKSILSNGLQPRYCLEDADFYGNDHVGYPMVCFCDIPISRLSDHTNFYGEYGIGLSKEWGLTNGVEPVIYSTSSGVAPSVVRFLDELTDENNEEKTEEFRDDILRHWNQLIPRIKPIQGTMIVGGEFVEKEFYQENEWRFVPDTFFTAFEGHEDFQKKLDEYNEQVVGDTIHFSPKDVLYIFVKNESEIPVLFDYIQNNLGQYPLNDIKILSSRITSIETLSKDL